MISGAPYIAIDTKKLPAEDVAFYMSEYRRAYIADSTDRHRCLRNMLAYCGINDGQWAEEVRAELIRQGRDPKTYNFLRFLVAGHGGNFVMNSVDPKYTDREDDSVDTMESIQALTAAWYSMKNRGGYKGQSMLCIENGLVYRGVQELYIHRPTSDPRTWLITFPSCRPELVTFDPSNTSDDISRTAQVAWKQVYMLPSQMEQLWPNSQGDLLQSLLLHEKKNGREYDHTDIDAFRNLDTRQFHGKYAVIQKMYIQHEKVTHQIHRTLGMLPVTEYPLGSIGDITQKKMYGMRFGIEIKDDDVLTVTDYKPVNYLAIFCPDLGVVFTDAKDERQLDGHLPLYAWSFLQKYGKSMGLIDFLVDAQDDLNKRNMAKTKILTQTPISGKPWISEDLADVEGQRLDEVIDKFNDGAHVLKVPSGMPASSMAGIIPGTNLNAGLLQDESIKIDFMNRLAALPLAMQGMTERSGESGIHAGRKIIEGTVMNRIPTEWVMQHELHKAQDWTKVFLQMFRDLPNITFSSADGSAKTTVNRTEGFAPDGKMVVKANLNTLHEIDVNIVLTKENDYMKQYKKETAVASLQAIGPLNQTNAPIHAAFSCELALNMDFTNDEHKKRVEDAANKTLEVAMAEADVRLMTLKAQADNLKAQMNGGMMGPQQKPGASPPAGPTQQQAQPPQPPAGPRPPVAEMERIAA